MTHFWPTITWSALALASIACGGNDSSNGDGDGDASGDGDLGTGGDGDSGGTRGDGDGDISGDGDGDAGGDGDGDAGGDGDSGGTRGDGDASGDGDLGTGGSAGGSPGSGGTGGNGATGPCHDEMCGGDCVPTTDNALSCEAEWNCLNVLTCLRDIASYCGCDGKTFEASSNCAPYAFAHRGACKEGNLGGLNCDATEVVTDDLPPECDFGYLPQVIDGSWGSCVPINECSCGTSGSQDECGPDYVCYNAGYCGQLLTKSLP